MLAPFGKNTLEKLTPPQGDTSTVVSSNIPACCSSENAAGLIMST